MAANQETEKCLQTPCWQSKEGTKFFLHHYCKNALSDPVEVRGYLQTFLKKQAMITLQEMAVFNGLYGS